MSAITENYENIVIGGGPTGLTMALYLSDLGEKVC